MWVKQVTEWTTARAKKLHACNNSEIVMKTKMVLVQASMHVNNSKGSKKSRKKLSDNE